MTSLKKPEPRILILDFDGVVVQSNDIKDAAFRTIFEKHFPHRRDDLMKYHLTYNAIPRREKFRHVVENLVSDRRGEALVDELTREFETLTRTAVIACPYVEGALQFLEKWSRKRPIYLASATPQIDLDLVVEGRKIQRYFKGVYGAEEPKPQVIRRLLAQHICEPEDALFIGDSPEDLQSARATGVRFAGIHGKTDFKNEPVPSFPNLRLLDAWL